MACVRQLSSSRVSVGGSTHIDLLLRNDARLPSTMLLLEDRLPYELGSAPRFLIERLEPSGSRRVTYEITPSLRGRYRIGPLTIKLTDPFGCVELSHDFSSFQDIVVTPATVPLPGLGTLAARINSGDHSSRSLSAVGEVDVGTREYRQGDDVRKVHWRSTARVGQLMVRQEEAGRTRRAAVLLDSRKLAHRGNNVNGSLEWAVSAAASVVVHLTKREHAVDLAAGSAFISHANLTASVMRDHSLERLAEVSLTPPSSLRGDIAMLRSRAAECGSIFAILGSLDADDIHALIPLGASISDARAILLDVASWQQQGTDKDPADQKALRAAQKQLTAAGWKLTIARRGDRIEDCWSQSGARA